MKFSAKLEGLLTALNPVFAVSEVGVKREYPDALKVTIDAQKDTLVLTANNGYVSALLDCKNIPDLEYSVETEEKVTVSTALFRNALKSFSTSETLTLSVNGGELEIRPESDHDKFQTIPIESVNVEMPTFPDSGAKSKKVSVSREIFKDAIKQVIWAVGVESLRPQFFYWKLVYTPDSFRAVAGDGGIFAVHHVSGKKIADGKGVIFIYREYNAVLVKVSELSSAENIEICDYEQGDSSPEQIQVALDDLKLTFMGHDSGVIWPDENKFINRNSAYKFVTQSDSWQKEFLGIQATLSKDITIAHDVHTTEMTFDSIKKIITLKVDGPLKALRKIPLLDCSLPDGQTSASFVLETANLNNIIKQASGNFQIELEDSSQPMIVRYYAGNKIDDGNVNIINQNTVNGTDEQKVVFLAPKAK